MNKKFLLHENWKFKLNDRASGTEKLFLKRIKPNEWLVAKVPGTVLTDLLNLKLIPDPFYADNELKLQWVAEKDWLYTNEFNFPKEFEKGKSVYLVFEGIDTAAKIYLNGNEIAAVDNMFLKYQFEVSSILKKKRNTLEVLFISPVKYGKEQESKYGRLSAALNSERVHIRKAQYSFGWDWGPKFPVSGLWRPVYLFQMNEIHIENFIFDTLTIENGRAIVEVKINLNQSLKANQNIKLELKNERQYFEFDINDKGKNLSNQFELQHPDLWWPNGLGEQTLYNISIKVVEDGKVVDELVERVGIRKIKLVLRENEKPAFKFIINNFPVFLRGANWIPGDCFLPNVSEEKYRALLQMAKEASMNMVRVWGGGIYENDIFYEVCDELGLLVWQDFMFACAAYPENAEFIQSVEEEIKYNVYRLQHHSSIAIWCGNNENEWIWYRQEKGSYKEMPGYKIFHEVIPGIVKEIDSQRSYWPTSPFSDEEDPNSVLSGNRHQWDLWSWWKDYNQVKNDQSLFVTEFGFQAPANQATLDEVIPEKERYPQSYLSEFHNKQIEGNERLFKFLYSHLPIRTKWEEFIYLTQLNQALALKTCLEHWRSNQPHTNGSIIWQLNDTWPVTSWSLIDSNILPKLSYYFVKKSFQNQVLFLNRKEESLEISVINNDRKGFSGWIELHTIFLPKGKTEHIVNKKIKLGENSKREVITLAIPDYIMAGQGIFLASLYGEAGELLNRNFYADKEWKHLKLPDAKIKIKQRSKKDFPAVEISSDLPAFFVYLTNPGFLFKDNGFIILPDEKIYVGMKKRKTKQNDKTEYFCLNHY